MAKITIKGISISTDTSGRWVDVKEVEKIISDLTNSKIIEFVDNKEIKKKTKDLTKPKIVGKKTTKQSKVKK